VRVSMIALATVPYDSQDLRQRLEQHASPVLEKRMDEVEQEITAKLCAMGCDLTMLKSQHLGFLRFGQKLEQTIPKIAGLKDDLMQLRLDVSMLGGNVTRVENMDHEQGRGLTTATSEVSDLKECFTRLHERMTSIQDLLPPGFNTKLNGTRGTIPTSPDFFLMGARMEEQSQQIQDLSTRVNDITKLVETKRKASGKIGDSGLAEQGLAKTSKPIPLQHEDIHSCVDDIGVTTEPCILLKAGPNAKQQETSLLLRLHCRWSAQRVLWCIFVGLLNVFFGAFATATREITTMKRKGIIKAELDRLTTYLDKGKMFLPEAKGDADAKPMQGMFNDTLGGHAISFVGIGHGELEHEFSKLMENLSQYIYFFGDLHADRTKDKFGSHDSRKVQAGQEHQLTIIAGKRESMQAAMQLLIQSRDAQKDQTNDLQDTLRSASTKDFQKSVKSLRDESQEALSKLQQEQLSMTGQLSALTT